MMRISLLFVSLLSLIALQAAAVASKGHQQPHGVTKKQPAATSSISIVERTFDAGTNLAEKTLALAAHFALRVAHVDHQKAPLTALAALKREINATNAQTIEALRHATAASRKRLRASASSASSTSSMQFHLHGPHANIFAGEGLNALETTVDSAIDFGIGAAQALLTQGMIMSQSLLGNAIGTGISGVLGAVRDVLAAARDAAKAAVHMALQIVRDPSQVLNTLTQGLGEITQQVEAAVAAALEAAKAALTMGVDLLGELGGGSPGPSPPAPPPPSPVGPSPRDGIDDDIKDDLPKGVDSELVERRRLVRRLTRAVDVSGRSIIEGFKRARVQLVRAVHESEPQLQALAKRAIARRGQKTHG